MAALSRSSRPASGSRYSGSTRGPSTSRAPITGSASRNTEPHQKASSTSPPSTGPTALPAENAPIQTPTASERSFGSWNMWKISESVDGATVAPAIPSSARLTISISGVVENAASTDTARRRLRRSAAAAAGRSGRPSVPIVTSAPATMNP